MLLGDVTLSAEDLPLKQSHAVPSIDVEPIPVDHQSPYEDDEDDIGYDEEEEEPHHSWLGGSTAVKFLLAGGVAGAGEPCCLMIPVFCFDFPSISNVHGTV